MLDFVETYTKDSFDACLSHFEQHIASFLLFFSFHIILRLNFAPFSVRGKLQKKTPRGKKRLLRGKDS